MSNSGISNIVKSQVNTQMETCTEEISYLPGSVAPSQNSLNKANPFHTRPLSNGLAASLSLLLSLLHHFIYEQEAIGSVILSMSAVGVIGTLARY